jgi:pyruvate dehydrogenase (quinone)
MVIDALVDPNEPPLPPHISFEQAKEFAKSILEGDPDRSAYVKAAVKEKVDEFLPGR